MRSPLPATARSASFYGGKSLGSALAVALAAEKPVGNLVLEAPFTSVADVGARHYWFVPVRLFMKDKFRSDLLAAKVTAPRCSDYARRAAICHDPGAQALRASCRRRE